MSLVIRFAPSSMTADQYDEVIKQLEDAGAGAPAGRLHHIACTGPGGIEVIDLWESQETFDAFGAVLMPILAGLDIDPGAPDVRPAHRVIRG